MSRIGKKPVEIPAGVTVEQKGVKIKATGPQGTLEMQCHPQIKVTIDKADAKIVVENDNPQDRRCKQLHGTMRALIANLVAGVTKGFERKMEIYGTGYNLKEQNGKLSFQVGYAHSVDLAIPKGVKVTIAVPATKGNEVPAKFTLFGMDKCVIGQFAAEIRSIRPPEPYKGKGIRYADEQVQRKVGKAFASGTA